MLFQTAFLFKNFSNYQIIELTFGCCQFYMSIMHFTLSFTTEKMGEKGSLSQID